MKKLFLLFVFLTLWTVSIFSQALDFPAWLTDEMTINEIRNELRGISISRGSGSYYIYTQNGRTHNFLLPNGWDLIQYVVKAPNIDITKLISDLSYKYNLPQPEYKNNFYRWDLKKLAQQRRISLYHDRNISSIEISQEIDSIVSLCVSFISFNEWEEAILEVLNNNRQTPNRIFRVDEDMLNLSF